MTNKELIMALLQFPLEAQVLVFTRDMKPKTAILGSVSKVEEIAGSVQIKVE